MRSFKLWKRLGLVAIAGITILAAIAGASIKQPAQAYPPYDLRIYNRSSYDMISFFATNSYNTGWGYDRFGDDFVLRRGYNIKLNLADGTGACYFDLRAVLRNRREAIAYNVYICGYDGWNVYD